MLSRTGRHVTFGTQLLEHPAILGWLSLPRVSATKFEAIMTMRQKNEWKTQTSIVIVWTRRIEGNPPCWSLAAKMMEIHHPNLPIYRANYRGLELRTPFVTKRSPILHPLFYCILKVCACEPLEKILVGVIWPTIWKMMEIWHPFFSDHWKPCQAKPNRP